MNRLLAPRESSGKGPCSYTTSPTWPNFQSTRLRLNEEHISCHAAQGPLHLVLPKTLIIVRFPWFWPKTLISAKNLDLRCLFPWFQHGGRPPCAPSNQGIWPMGSWNQGFWLKSRKTDNIKVFGKTRWRGLRWIRGLVLSSIFPHFTSSSNW